MRSLSKVIRFLVEEVIPHDQARVRNRLDYLANRFAYTPPECILERWQELEFILEEELGEPAGITWKERVSNIVEDREKIP